MSPPSSDVLSFEYWIGSLSYESVFLLIQKAKNAKNMFTPPVIHY